ncbi:MAG: hypothetical protein JSV43_00485 [Methanobacteriota archaeon]|nr:MAG: hypothetical protein JSV43_00485 [Euryarchaeota archaeon]
MRGVSCEVGYQLREGFAFEDDWELDMPERYTYPGVYIKEVRSEVRTIAGIATSIAAFVGCALRGEVDKHVKVISQENFERKFGGLSLNANRCAAVENL